ncbi:DNA replication protein DnaC [Peptoniphilus olsenii]|uniref:DNA replication protein DnaC n=1 Tax=Peptoniphilus olsenii TaxID=411570 RepID=A0ABV2J7Y8_9FIRM
MDSLKEQKNIWTDEEQKKLAIFEMNGFNSAIGSETNCTKCRDKGYIMQIKKENGIYYPYVTECSCIKSKKAETKAEKSGTKPLLKFSFDNFFVTHDWQKNIKNLAEENAKTKDWFFIGGQSGAGKTHICSAISNYQSRKNIRVKHIVWTDEIDKLKNFDDTSLIDELKRVECLYIDDMFKKAISDNGISLTNADITKTWELLNFRANNKLKTIISTELTHDELVKIDESLAGRIKAKAGKFVINLYRDKDKNLRLQ